MTPKELKENLLLDLRTALIGEYTANKSELPSKVSLADYVDKLTDTQMLCILRERFKTSFGLEKRIEAYPDLAQDTRASISNDAAPL